MHSYAISEQLDVMPDLRSAEQNIVGCEQQISRKRQINGYFSWRRLQPAAALVGEWHEIRDVALTQAQKEENGRVKRKMLNQNSLSL